MFKSLLLFVLVSVAFAQQERLMEAEQSFGKELSKACEVTVRFNLHDYAYGQEEGSLYSNRHFEDCSVLSYLAAQACEKHPKNKMALRKVKEIVCQRGSVNESRILLRKNGTLVFRIHSSPDREKIIKAGLESAIGFDFVSDFKKEQQDKKLAEKEAKEKIQESAQKSNLDQKQKKINELTAWFQAEVQKLTKNPGPDMAEKIERLTKTYEEKLNAITSAR